MSKKIKNEKDYQLLTLIFIYAFVFLLLIRTGRFMVKYIIK